jgi:predicted RNase H-like HicB family nuclease
VEFGSTSGRVEMKRYAIVIDRSPNNYGAYVPDLPGCVATGQTIEETKRNIREAIAWHIEAMREDGEAVPEPTVTVDFAEVA